MWVYDIKTLKFIAVNEAAIFLYGYSLQEFKRMTLKDIRPPEDIPILMNQIVTETSTIHESGTYRHNKKDGSTILVKMSSHNIDFHEMNARVITVIDVTEKVAAKQSLITEVAKLNSIIESTSDAIFSVDGNYCYTSFNTAHSDMIKKAGNATTEIGTNFLSYFVIEQEKLTAKTNIDKALKGERIDQLITIGDDVRTQIHLDISHNPIKNENGDVIGVSVFTKDITNQKKSSEKVKQLSKAVEQSPVTIIVTDTDGNIQYMNPKGVEITGFRLDEIIGKNPRVFSSGEMKKEDYQKLWGNLKSGNEWRGEFHNKKKNGDLYWELASISPIVNEKGETTNFLAIKEDITDRKNTEQELIAAKEKAEEINKIKSSFLSNMSHELRTPLAGILGFADILSETLTDETEKSMSESILQSGKRLLNTLTSLLSLSELETAKPNIELKEINANAVCNDIINFHKVNSKNPNVEFRTDFESGKMNLKINYRLLRDALENLVQNSVTYTQSGSIIIKTYKKVVPESENSFSIIEVVDTGVGIQKDKLKIIFEEFRQGSEGLTRNYDGLGLGLTLSKKYLHLIGATIDIESEVGTGTKLIITFQNNYENKSESQNAEQIGKSDSDIRIPLRKTNSKIRDKRILLVEDDHINQLFIEKCLSKLCKFVSVSTGEQAIKISSENKFDLILMDINLGKGMDGTTAARMIRKIYGHESTEMVAMTAFASNEDKKKFLLEGFSYYISKPFYRYQIIQLVNEILSEKEI